MTYEPVDLPEPANGLLRSRLNYSPVRLRGYGNTRLLTGKLWHSPESLLRSCDVATLDKIERDTEEAVLSGFTLVCGVATPGNQRSAVVPLRWGSPRIVVIPCGLHAAMGPDLKEELFRAARLWRYQFDPQTDLVIALGADHSKGFIAHDTRVNRIIATLCTLTPSGDLT
jgi:hypothetical protein